MTCYEISSGAYPWGGLSAPEIISKVKAGLRPPLPNGVPGEVRDLIFGQWSQIPGKRKRFNDLSRDLVPVWNGQIVAARGL